MSRKAFDIVVWVSLAVLVLTAVVRLVIGV